jgi:hypothetical protein
MWAVALVFAVGCLGALIGGVVVVAASWRAVMKDFDNE